MYDQVKLILHIVSNDLSSFPIFISFILFFQLCVASAVIQISEDHLFVAFDPKSILIDLFALMVINNVDDYIGSFYLKYEISGTEEGHEIINSDEFLRFDFTIM